MQAPTGLMSIIVSRVCGAVLFGARATLVVAAALGSAVGNLLSQILGFTPVWLDAATLLAASVGVFVLLTFGRGGTRLPHQFNQTESK
jgi:ABC-type Na+ efflux pump permease subunit